MPELVVEYVYADGTNAVWLYLDGENLTEAFMPVQLEDNEPIPTGLLSIIVRPRQDGEEVME